MRSNNPVFRRSEEFSRAGAAPQSQSYAGYGQPSQWGVGQPGALGYDDVRAPAGGTGRMTIDSVVQTTTITLGAVVVAAFATWILTPDIDSRAALGPLYAALVIGSLGAFVLSLVNSFKRVVSPALVLTFAVFEGVFIGAFSKVVDSVYGDGLVVQAVVGTFAAFAGTLAAYKFFNIQVGQRFRTFVIAAMFGMVGLALLEGVLSIFGGAFGLFGFGGLGILTAVAGLVLGVFMLILDYDQVEQGIRNGLPQRESWRASFGLTVSLVWIYTNLLRLLAILSDN
jgi:uncharacterized YccA/Bax inhibitor family protein